MIDFPIADLFDDSLCLLWLERHLHPNGFVCPHCGSANRRLFRRQGHYDAYRCRDCDGYYTLLSGTVFEGSRKRPAVLVLLLRGIAKGESTALTCSPRSGQVAMLESVFDDWSFLQSCLNSTGVRYPKLLCGRSSL